MGESVGLLLCCFLLNGCLMHPCAHCAFLVCLQEDYLTIMQSYGFYAVCSGGNTFTVKLNSYLDFLNDCQIPDDTPGASPKNLDTLFIVTNLEEGLDKQEAKTNDDKALMRFEWVEIIVRIAMTKYYDSGKVEDLSEAVDHLCKQNIHPNLEDVATQRGRQL